MTVLPDFKILEEIEAGNISVEPFNQNKQMQPASIDVRLGANFAMFRDPNGIQIHPDSDVESEMVEWKSDAVNVGSGEFLLANTVESFQIPDNIGAEIRGRSSLGRLGIEVHSCAGWIDPGFNGELVLEISNNSNNNVTLQTGQRIAQIVFYRLEEKCNMSYGQRANKYQNQKGPQASLIKDDE